MIGHGGCLRSERCGMEMLEASLYILLIYHEFQLFNFQERLVKHVPSFISSLNLSTLQIC